MSTVEFDRDERRRDPLLRRISGLPREVSPRQDLWPGIRARIERESPGAQPVAGGLSWGWAAAAGAAVAAVSVLFTWLSVRSPAPVRVADGGPAPVEAISAVSYGGYARLGPEYVETRAQMLGQFRDRLADLPPGTRRRVERDLTAIRDAANDIDAALAGDPASRLLNQLLLSTYQEELRLYSRVAATDAAAGQRTST